MSDAGQCAPGRRATLRRRERLPGGAGITAVLRSGQRWQGTWLRVLWRAGAAPHDRVGVVVARGAGGAVQRNRARRLLKEVFRTNKSAAPPFSDIVLIARSGGRTGLAELEQEYRRWRDECRPG